MKAYVVFNCMNKDGYWGTGCSEVNLLNENLTFDDILGLADEIKKCSKYDSVIILNIIPLTSRNLHTPL